MQRTWPLRLLLVTAVSACGFAIATMGTDDTGTGEDPLADAFVAPDAGMCATATFKECVGPLLRECTQPGALPTDTACAWGCSSLGAPHCAQLLPSGGAVTAADLMPTEGLLDVSLQGPATIDTATGEIAPGIRAAGVGLDHGIDFHVASGVGIFRFRGLTVKGTLTGVGSNALALVSTAGITVQGLIDVEGDCTNRHAGPGGHDGAVRGQAANGSGAGGKGIAVIGGCTAGGGGGNGASGGNGGGANNRGGAFYDPAHPVVLTGGGGGGGGGGSNGGDGGGGGGAIQLVANGPVLVEGTTPIEGAGILAGGCFGRGAGDCGGGGGAGGTILIEAPTIELASCVLSVNGGGAGGGGEPLGQRRPGLDGSAAHNSSAQVAKGGARGGNGATDGADGGLRGSLGGHSAQISSHSGGGGGGVGRIRFHTYSGQVTITGASISPSLTESNTTTTRATASVQ